MEVMEDLEDIVVAEPATMLSAREILQGKTFDPITQVKMYSPSEYEIFICEWTSTLKGMYSRVFKSKGGGDMGRDVACFYDSTPGGRWDNYQCKHYDHPLSPGDIRLEVGKLIFYTHRGDFPCPGKYFFVGPQGISNASLKLLEDTAALKADMKANWASACETSITKKTPVKLEGSLLSYLENFDFSIFTFKEPQEVINEHAGSVWSTRRFGGGLKPRPKVTAPPSSIQEPEQIYTTALIGAYSERDGKELKLEDVLKHSIHGPHLAMQRRYFYTAESLRQFAKDTLPNNGDFEELQEQIFDGVIETLNEKHKDALERADRVLQKAKNFGVAHVLEPEVRAADKGGICHQLVNDKKIKWSKDEK